MKPSLVVLFLSIAVCAVNAQGNGIVTPGAVLEKVFGGAEFTEGPAMGPDGCIYFSDLTWAETTSADGHLWRYDPRSGTCGVYRSPSGLSNGIKFDAEGRMIVAQGSDFGGRGLVRTDLRTGKSEVLLSSFEGKPLNSPNDLIIDSKGRIYFTDPRYGDTRSVQQPVMGVYRLDPDGNVTRIIGDIPMPNGIALSPDERTLYVGCNDEGVEAHDTVAARPPLMLLLAYALSTEGNASSRRVLVRFAPDAGPDGITVDRAGHLYVAVRDEKHPAVGVYNPDGSLAGNISVPEVPSNAAFGRPPADDLLYITAGGGLYRVKVRAKGFFPYKLPFVRIIKNME